MQERYRGAVRFLARKYGLTDAEAERLARHSMSSVIIREHAEWCARQAVAVDSPLGRGNLLERF